MHGGYPAVLARLPDAGVPKLGAIKVGPFDMAKVEPVPVWAPIDVAFPTEVITPVKLAFVVTLPAVNADAVPDMFVPTKVEGVPRLGAMRVGLFDSTIVPPLPVTVHPDKAVPFPCKHGELTVVVKVIAGVDVAVATVPARPLADTTDIVVTVPAVAGGRLAHPEPVEVSTLPEAPAEVSPVPPLPTCVYQTCATESKRPTGTNAPPSYSSSV